MDILGSRINLRILHILVLENRVRVVAISDTHCMLDRITIPDGDILVHAGDLTSCGNLRETAKELFELSKHRARFKHTLLVPGNHDHLFQRSPGIAEQMCKDNGITLLLDSEASIEGIPFYGSPWQPEFNRWAFGLPIGEELKAKWDAIPDNTQVLITHSPPKWVRDYVVKFDRKIREYKIEYLGCPDLYNRILELKELKSSIFGHIHECSGIEISKGVIYINASICDGNYNPRNPVRVFDI